MDEYVSVTREFLQGLINALDQQIQLNKRFESRLSRLEMAVLPIAPKPSQPVLKRHRYTDEELDAIIKRVREE